MCATPDSDDRVIKTLELQFSRPSLIAHNLINQLFKIPPLTDDRINLLIDLSTSINNLVVAIETLQNTESFFYIISKNSQLLEEIVAILTHSLKLKWDEELVKEECSKANLKDFKNWLYQ